MTEDTRHQGFPSSVEEFGDFRNVRDYEETNVPAPPKRNDAAAAAAPIVRELKQLAYLIRYKCEPCNKFYYLQNSHAAPHRDFRPSCPYCQRQESSYNGIAELERNVGLRTR